MWDCGILLRTAAEGRGLTLPPPPPQPQVTNDQLTDASSLCPGGQAVAEDTQTACGDVLKDKLLAFCRRYTASLPSVQRRVFISEFLKVAVMERLHCTGVSLVLRVLLDTPANADGTPLLTDDTLRLLDEFIVVRVQKHFPMWLEVWMLVGRGSYSATLRPAGRSSSSSRDALEGGGGNRPPSRAPSLCAATVSMTASASFNGSCNRQ